MKQNAIEPASDHSSESSGTDGMLERLREVIRRHGPMLVAYSGGIDSALVLKVAHDVLGEGAVGVTAVSASLPDAERRRAAELARSIGVRHLEVDTLEMDDPRYTSNPLNRCYFCKTELFDRLSVVARDLGFEVVAYGANTDDLGDFRPGMDAAREAGIRAPLLEAALGKADVRALSRRLGLPGWDRPASPCLSSRIPHGVEVTPERLARIEAAEAALAGLGFRELRVRYHGDVARIELAEREIERLLDPAIRLRVARAVREAGFRFVALDLDGYRTGSLNVLD